MEQAIRNLQQQPQQQPLPLQSLPLQWGSPEAVQAAYVKLLILKVLLQTYQRKLESRPVPTLNRARIVEIHNDWAADDNFDRLTALLAVELCPWKVVSREE